MSRDIRDKMQDECNLENNLNLAQNRKFQKTSVNCGANCQKWYCHQFSADFPSFLFP